MTRTEDEDEVDVLEDEDEGEAEDNGSVDPIVAHFDAVDDRVEDLCDTVLAPRFAALESDRLRVQGAIRRGLILVGVPFALFFVSDAVAAILEALGGHIAAVRFLVSHLTLAIVAILIVAIAFVVMRLVLPGVAAQLTYRRRFKNEVVVELFKLLRPHDTYQPDAHVSAEVFERSGLWAAPYASFAGDDLMRGRVGDVEFEASEIRAHGRITVSRGKRERTWRPNVTKFHGAFFHLALAHTLKGHTIIEPEDAEGRLPQHRRQFEPVTIEDQAFADSFRVYSTDAAEARALVTPGLRAGLLTLSDHLSQQPFLAFVGDDAFVALHSGKTLLEPMIAQRVSDGTLSRIGEYFALPEVLVNELGVASSSATFATSARGSILAQPAAVSPIAASSLEGIETGDLLTLGMEQVDERDASRRAPPESRVRLSPLTSEGLTVTYGITPSFYVRLLWTLVLTPFVAAATARLAGEPGTALLASLSAQIPSVALAAEWASQWPWVFVAVALFIYVLPTWGLLHIPRAVHIERTGVRVSKRLWPFAKVHPIDRIADVKVSERQVVLVRKDASLLRRMAFPAPPMPTADDARWLAAHFRRAIKFFGGLGK
jgi:hypothetical protein